jgi:hypothetical protein
MLDFLGIGAQKAGTTWLYESLRLHPELAFPAGKEIHFWDRNRFRGIKWYQDLFDASAHKGKKCGEITPAYAILAKDVIAECYGYYPDLKIIYLLRNPKERAWSSAKMALKRAEMEIHEASEQWFADHFLSKQSISRGDYESCLRNWLSLYPAEQIMIRRFEELQDDPTSLIRQCFRHIGINPEVEIMADLQMKVFASAPYELPHSLKSLLSSIYDPKISSLEAFLGYDLSTWR